MAKELRTNPPEGYKLSRAALRERYGARSIDASSRRSAQDFTPSGRQEFLQQNRLDARGRPISPTAAEAERQMEWGDQFKFRLPMEVKPKMAQIPNNLPLLSTPPKQLGLLPETQGPETMTAFLPPTTTPLTGFSTPPIRSGLLSPQNKWRTSIFG